MIVSEIKGDEIYSPEIKASGWRLVSGVIMFLLPIYGFTR